MSDPVPDCCSICLDDINSKPNTTTSCSHIFHKVCLTAWFMIKHTCPYCRQELSKKTVPRYSWLNGTIDDLIEVLLEPRYIQSDDLDGTRIEWNYQTIDGNLVTIYGYQQCSLTSVNMPFFEEGNDTLDSDSIYEIDKLLRTTFKKKMRNNATV